MTLKQQLQNKRQAILSIAERYGAFDLRIFGSVAREEERSDSDIDLLVNMEEGRSLLDYIGFVQELESLLERKVDVAQPTTLHQVIREQVLKEAVPL